MIGKDGRAIGRADASNIVEVLDRDRQAAEPGTGPAVRRIPAFDALRLFAGPLEAPRRQGIERPVSLLDAPEGHLQQFQGRYFAFGQQLDNIPGRLKQEVTVGGVTIHDVSLVKLPGTKNRARER